MYRTLPATEQINQLNSRINDLKESVIDNIKSSQILRSNYATMLHTSKESNESLKLDINEILSSIRKELVISTSVHDENIKEMDKDLVALNYDKRVFEDSILILDKRIKHLENVFGYFDEENSEI
jgi:sugar-specific transcriptional regulator TrmB